MFAWAAAFEAWFVVCFSPSSVLPLVCCLFAATHTIVGRIAGQLSRVITATPRFSRQRTPSGRLEQPPALSS